MHDPDIVREFEEVDEKLPYLARILINRQIDFRQLESDDPDPEVMKTILVIMRENLECFSEMTGDEIDATLNMLDTACEVTCLVNDGICEEATPGNYILTQEGRQYYESLFGAEAEDNSPCCDF